MQKSTSFREQASDRSRIAGAQQSFATTQLAKRCTVSPVASSTSPFVVSISYSICKRGLALTSAVLAGKPFQWLTGVDGLGKLRRQVPCEVQ